MGYRGSKKGNYGNRSKRSVKSVQSSRSKRARSIDALKKAPIAENIEQWKHTPNRYDLQGIDTPHKQNTEKGQVTTWKLSDKAVDELAKLLRKYGKTQEKLDVLDRETSDILSTSAMGQAPPVFHRKVDQMVEIKRKKQAPLWEKIRGRIIPNSHFKTFWQEIPWTFGTLPPEYTEILKAYAKYNPTDKKSAK